MEQITAKFGWINSPPACLAAEFYIKVNDEVVHSERDGATVLMVYGQAFAQKGGAATLFATQMSAPQAIIFATNLLESAKEALAEHETYPIVNADVDVTSGMATIDVTDLSNIDTETFFN